MMVKNVFSLHRQAVGRQVGGVGIQWKFHHNKYNPSPSSNVIGCMVGGWAGNGYPPVIMQKASRWLQDAMANHTSSEGKVMGTAWFQE